MDELLVDFQKESQGLIDECEETLDKAEDSIDNKEDLATFANLIDRVMGGAETVEQVLDEENPALTCIAQLTRLCKIIGYRSRHVEDEQVYDIIVAFLQDATEISGNLVKNMEGATKENVKSFFHDHLIKRMNFVAEKLPADGPLLPDEKDYNNEDMQALIDDILS